MKEFVKKYWWVFILCIGFFIAAWFIKPNKITDTTPDLIPQHQIDSLKYAKTTDSLTQIIDTLKAQLKNKKTEYITIIKNQGLELDKIKKLPATELVKEFSKRTGDSVKLVILEKDTTVIAPMASIKEAVILMVKGEQAEIREMKLTSQLNTANSLIEKQDAKLATNDIRISQLTKEFYTSQILISGLEADVSKEQKRNRTKNVVIGCLIGVSVTAGIIAILK